MLGEKRKKRKWLLAEALERYLTKVLHVQVHVDALEEPPAGLPAFLERAYAFFGASIAGRPCLILAAGEDMASISDIAKHIRLVRAVAGDMIVVFAATSLSASSRSRLVERGVPFVVPENQLYIPDLALDLREHFRAPRPASPDGGLSPAAQAVLFLHLLRLDEEAASPSFYADRLRYTAMSIGRAFDELIALSLAEDDRYSKQRHIHFKLPARPLLDAARNHLRSPVRGVHYVKSGGTSASMKLAGETALAELTDISRPQLDTYAVAASSWKQLLKDRYFTETDKDDAEFRVETWSYDPSGLTAKPTVDPLSLYAQFKDNSDERIAGAAEQLLEEIQW
jgi:hypothetical protein